MMGYHLKFIDSIGKKTHRIDVGHICIDTGVKNGYSFAKVSILLNIADILIQIPMYFHHCTNYLKILINQKNIRDYAENV